MVSMFTSVCSDSAPMVIKRSGIENAFIANVGSKPELKTSAAGKPWAAFSACVGDGEDAQWLACRRLR
jgi:hypothetical protein